MKCFIFVSLPPDIPNCDKLLAKCKSKPSSLLGNRVQTFHAGHLRSQILHLLRSNLASALTYRKVAASWIHILTFKVSVIQGGLIVRKLYRQQHNIQYAISCRQTPCVDHHVKQHSQGADLKTSHGKNADIRSVLEGVWFRNKARGNSESSVLK